MRADLRLWLLYCSGTPLPFVCVCVFLYNNGPSINANRTSIVALCGAYTAEPLLVTAALHISRLQTHTAKSGPGTRLYYIKWGVRAARFTHWPSVGWRFPIWSEAPASTSSSIVSDEMKACTGRQLEALKPLKDAPQLWTMTVHYMCTLVFRRASVFDRKNTCQLLFFEFLIHILVHVMEYESWCTPFIIM